MGIANKKRTIIHNGEAISVAEGAVITKIPYGTLYDYIKNRGCKSCSEALVIRKRLYEENGHWTNHAQSPTNISSDFDRNKVCRREGFEFRCSFYDSCSEARTETKFHHKRYKEDGSCYKGKRFKGSDPNSSGRGAREYNGNGSIRS